MNALANAGERTAPADIGDRGVDVFIRCVGIVIQQASCGHDHAWLAETALRDVEFHPRLLDGVTAVFRQAFNCCDFLVAGQGSNRVNTRPDGLSVDMDRAGAALCDSASILCAGEP